MQFFSRFDTAIWRCHRSGRSPPRSIPCRNGGRAGFDLMHPAPQWLSTDFQAGGSKPHLPRDTWHHPSRTAPFQTHFYSDALRSDFPVTVPGSNLIPGNPWPPLVPIHASRRNFKQWSMVGAVRRRRYLRSSWYTKYTKINSVFINKTEEYFEPC